MKNTQKQEKAAIHTLKELRRLDSLSMMINLRFPITVPTRAAVNFVILSILVRLHKFGHLDTSGQNGVQSKSYLAMTEFCQTEEKVKKTIATEKIVETKYDFAEKPEEEVKTDWAVDMELDGKGKYLSSAHNISLVFANDPNLKGTFQENAFDNKKYVINKMPWRKVLKPEPIKNVDFSGIRNYIEIVYGISGVSKIEDALNLEFERYSFHPVKEFLNGLKWDKVQRIDTLLIEYFGAFDNVYTREAMRKMLVGAVARIFNPGVKFDLVLTLVGNKQGTGKSTFIDKIGKDWFSDSFHTVQGKEAFEQLQGAWLIEMAELSGVRKSEVEAIKHFITKREDTYRPAYGRIVETYKRQCVFFATTNEKDFLRDPSGNRRFMPIDVNEDQIKKSSLDENNLTEEEINQIWAEAVALYRGGEKLYLSPEAEEIAKQEQKNHSYTDDRQGLIEEYLEKLLPANWDKLDLHERRVFLHDPLSKKGEIKRQFVCMAEIWCECLNKEKSEMNRYNTREINEILRSLEGWEQSNSTKNFKNYGKQKYYSRSLL